MNDSSTNRSRLFRALLPPVIWAALLFIESAIPSEKIPDMPILQYDKLIHMAIYLVFGALVYRFFRLEGLSPVVRSYAVMLTIGIVAFYGATDEFHQHFVPGRSMDVFDWIADVIGGILGVLVMLYMSRRNKLKSAPPEA